MPCSVPFIATTVATNRTALKRGQAACLAGTSFNCGGWYWVSEPPTNNGGSRGSIEGGRNGGSEGGGIADSRKTERELTCDRVNFANNALDFADALDKGGDKALVAAGASALIAIATSETVVGGVGFGAFAIFAGTGGLVTKLTASGVSMLGHTVGSLATNNKTAFRNNFMNGILGASTSGQGGVAGGLAESALQDAGKQPLPDRYKCP